jgi:hypothetical protein
VCSPGVQVKPTKFVAADDGDGEAAADHQRFFLSLWESMKGRGVVALCTWKATAASAPRLVALVVQEAEEDLQGKQVRLTSCAVPTVAQHTLSCMLVLFPVHLCVPFALREYLAPDP